MGEKYNISFGDFNEVETEQIKSLSKVIQRQFDEQFQNRSRSRHYTDALNDPAMVNNYGQGPFLQIGDIFQGTNYTIYSSKLKALKMFLIWILWNKFIF